MSYTVWSRGRLIGHTDLAFTEAVPGARAGFFFPTERGLAAVRIAVEAAEVLLAARDGGDHTTFKADLVAATDRCEALLLELRGPDGAVIPTTDISIRDTELMASWADLDDDDISSAQLSSAERRALDAAVEHDLMMLDDGFGTEWATAGEDEMEWNEPEFPRYQVYVK
jgi:hypothetical protein